MIATIENFLGAVADDRLGRAATLDAVSRLDGLGAIGEAALEELAAIDRALGAMKISESAVRFDPTIVRGLEYYTGTVFEAELLLETIDDKGRAVRYGSIGGGGRYDDLVARFTGQPLPATGFSFGVSRLLHAGAQMRQSRQHHIQLLCLPHLLQSLAKHGTQTANLTPTGCPATPATPAAAFAGAGPPAGRGAKYPAAPARDGRHRKWAGRPVAGALWG